jgi:hypothetical protein
MVWAISHCAKYTLDEVVWNISMKQVAHRIDEDHPRLPPSSWQINQILMRGQREAVTVALRAHCM